MFTTKWLKDPRHFSHAQLIVFALFFAAVGGFLLYKSFALNPNLPGDVNNDNTVNVTDLSILLSNYNTNYPQADFNSDGTVNILDMSILLSNYGRMYAGTPQPPTNQRQTGSTTTSITMAWDPPASGPLPSGYDVYLNSNKVASVNASTRSYTYNNLTCNTSYDVGLVTKDAAGNGSDLGLAHGPMSTTACTTQPPPPPPPPSGGGEAITSSQCTSRASVAGAVIDNVTVSGGCTIGASNVTIQNSTLSGVVDVQAAGFKLLSSKAQGFELESLGDNALIEGNTLDGKNTKEQNFIWADGKVGDGPTGWTIRNNYITNFTSPGSTHSEGIYIGGYASNGLIEGNTFYRNGNTGHIFFSWCAPNDCDGTGGTPRDPHDICVRGNTFDKTWTAYYQVVIRQETYAPNGHGIYTDDNIKIDMNPTQIAPGSQGVGGATDSNNYVQFMAGDNLQFQLSC